MVRREPTILVNVSNETLDPLDEQISFYRAEAGEYDAWLTNKLNRSEVTLDDPFVQGRERVAAMLDRLTLRGTALEIAAGTGSFSLLLAPLVDELILLDSSPESLAIAQGHLVDYRQVRYVQADVFRWTPTQRYDTVCFAAWLHHVPRARFDEFWGLVDRVLVPSGQVIFEFCDRALQRPFDYVEVPQVPSTEYRAYHQPERAVSIRDLGGRRWRVVHELWGADELSGNLARLGWNMQLETLGWDHGSHWASARRS